MIPVNVPVPRNSSSRPAYTSSMRTTYQRLGSAWPLVSVTVPDVACCGRAYGTYVSFTTRWRALSIHIVPEPCWSSCLLLENVIATVPVGQVVHGETIVNV